MTAEFKDLITDDKICLYERRLHKLAVSIKTAQGSVYRMVADSDNEIYRLLEEASVLIDYMQVELRYEELKLSVSDELK